MARDQDWNALADAVARRRSAVGFSTMKALADAIGVTAKLVQEIENARRVSYRPATLYGLERALRWSPGSVQVILDGGEPQELPVEIEHPNVGDEKVYLEDATDLELATEFLKRLSRRNGLRQPIEGRIGINVPDPDAPGEEPS